MNDLISRQAAIDALYHVNEYNSLSVKAIRNLPAAQPEMKRMKTMIRLENDCTGPCPQGCVDCGRKRSPHFYCDECGDEVLIGELREFEGRQLCAQCILNQFPVIE